MGLLIFGETNLPHSIARAYSFKNLIWTGLSYIYIHVEEGVVTLDGTVISGTDMANCERAVAAIEGVQRVNNQLSLSRVYLPGP